MLAKQIAEILLSTNAVKLNADDPFTYTSGLKGPIYTDNRVLISHPKERDIIVNAFADLIKERGLIPECLAGTSTAGIPWASFLAQKLDLPMVYVRSKPKGHGAGKQIEGYLKEGSSVLVIEDLVTTGGSALNTVNALRNEGKSIVHEAFSIFTYGLQKSVDGFIEASVALSALTDISVLAEVALEKGVVTEDQAAKINKFVSDPEGWLN